MNKTICSNHYSIFEMFTQWWLYSQLYLRIHGFYSITYPCFFSITYTCLRTVITYPFFLLYSLTTFPAYLLIHVSYILLIYVSYSTYLSMFRIYYLSMFPYQYFLLYLPPDAPLTTHLSMFPTTLHLEIQHSNHIWYAHQIAVDFLTLLAFNFSVSATRMCYSVLLRHILT